VDWSRGPEGYARVKRAAMSHPVMTGRGLEQGDIDAASHPRDG